MRIANLLLKILSSSGVHKLQLCPGRLHPLRLRGLHFAFSQGPTAHRTEWSKRLCRTSVSPPYKSRLRGLRIWRPSKNLNTPDDSIRTIPIRCSLRNSNRNTLPSPHRLLLRVTGIVVSFVGADTLSTGQPPPINSSHDSQLGTQLSNGPSTFEQAGTHLGFTPEEAQKLAFGYSLAASSWRILSPVDGPNPHARYTDPHSHPQQIGGDKECTNVPPHSIGPPMSLQPCGSPSASHASPQLPTRPDPEDASHQETIGDQATVSPPGRIEPLPGSDPMAFTKRQNGMFRCLVPVEGEFCGYVNKKKNRMLSHIRDKHLDQRPWHCGGQCGTRRW